MTSLTAGPSCLAVSCVMINTRIRSARRCPRRSCAPAGPAGGRPAAGSAGSWPASLVEQRRSCGKEGCRCARGELHGPYVYLQVAGRLVYVPAALAEAVRARLEISRTAAAGAGGDLGGQPGAAGPAGAGLGHGRGLRDAAAGPAAAGARAEMVARAGQHGRVRARGPSRAGGEPAVIRGEPKVTAPTWSAPRSCMSASRPWCRSASTPSPRCASTTWPRRRPGWAGRPPASR